MKKIELSSKETDLLIEKMASWKLYQNYQSFIKVALSLDETPEEEKIQVESNAQTLTEANWEYWDSGTDSIGKIAAVRRGIDLAKDEESLFSWWQSVGYYHHLRFENALFVRRLAELMFPTVLVN